MADPDDEDLSPEEILRKAEEAFNGGYRLFEAGHLPEAIAAFMRALELNRQVEGTERQQATCLTLIGSILSDTNRYQDSLTIYEMALGLWNNLPDTEGIQAVCLFSIGIALRNMGRYEEALTAFQQALDLYRTLPGTERQQADCLGNTGLALGEIGRYEEALSSYRDALALFRTLPDTERQQALCLGNTGITLDEVGRYEEARTPFRRALTPAIISALKSNAARFQFPTEHDRITWITERAEPSLDLALHLASINDQPALISDLIATFRTGGSIDITRLTTQGRTTTLGLITPNLTTHPEPNPHPTTPTPTGLALTASPPLGTDAVLSANLPRRPGPIFHMPHHRTALADYRQDDDTARPHAHYR